MERMRTEQEMVRRMRAELENMMERMRTEQKMVRRMRAE